MAEDTPSPSLLTEAFRDYLREKPDPSDYQRKLRKRLRERVRIGLNDFSVLNQKIRDDDLEQIFEKTRVWQGTEEQVKEYGEDHLEPGQLIETAEPGQQQPRVGIHHMIAFAWRGFRKIGMDKDQIFNEIVIPAIEWGEAQHKGTDPMKVESNITFNKLQAHSDIPDIDPLEKWKRDLALTGEDYQVLQDRLSEHPEVDEILGEDINELIEKHLIEDNADN